jgi:uncharacterized protein YjbJ (UPF0337 family)
LIPGFLGGSPYSSRSPIVVCSTGHEIAPGLQSGARRPKFQPEAVMNWEQVQGKWKQYAGKVHEKWGKLTNDDLDVIQGKREQLVGKIQERYGIAKEEAQRQVDDFFKSFPEDTGEQRSDKSRSAGRP